MRGLGLLIFAVWITAIASIIYAGIRRVPYLVGLRVCAVWASAVTVCLLLNYWLADLLELSKRSSGYLRGIQAQSSYGFFVQFLLVVEIGALVVILRWLKTIKSEPPSRQRAPELSVIKAADPSHLQPLLPSVQKSCVQSDRLGRTFRISGSTIFLLCCSAGNFWLGAKALQRSSACGVVFVVVAIGLLFVAFNTSVKRHAYKD